MLHRKWCCICNKFCLRVNAVISIEILLKCLMSLPEGKIQQVNYYPRNDATCVSCPRADVVTQAAPSWQHPTLGQHNPCCTISWVITITCQAVIKKLGPLKQWLTLIQLDPRWVYLPTQPLKKCMQYHWAVYDWSNCGNGSCVGHRHICSHCVIHSQIQMVILSVQWLMAT